MQVSKEDRKIFAQLTELYADLDNLDRFYDLMEAVGEGEFWKQKQDIAEQRINELLESLTPEQKQLFHSRDWTFGNG